MRTMRAILAAATILAAVALGVGRPAADHGPATTAFGKQWCDTCTD